MATYGVYDVAAITPCQRAALSIITPFFRAMRLYAAIYASAIPIRHADDAAIAADALR